MLQEIKKIVTTLQKYKVEAQYWVSKSNRYGEDVKREVTQIFSQLEAYCILSKDKKAQSSLDINAVQARMGTILRDKLTPNTDHFILFNMQPVNINREAQKLMRDFNVAEIALFLLKYKVDRETSFNPLYQTLVKQCYRFLIAFVRNNSAN